MPSPTTEPVLDHHMRPDRASSKPKRVLIVVANPAVASTVGWPVGFWGAELTHPYYELTERGVDVTIASPDGGKVLMDALSDPRHPSQWSANDLITMGFVNTPALMALLEDTPKVADLAPDSYDALMVAGGLSPMWTYREHRALQQTVLSFYQAEKPVGIYCHGTAVLADPRLSSGEYLAKGKTVTGFANVEEDFADNAVWEMGLLTRDRHVMPWRIEDGMKEIGANYIQSGLWRGFAVRDGNLITGQQNFSGAETARVVCEALGG